MSNRWLIGCIVVILSAFNQQSIYAIEGLGTIVELESDSNYAKSCSKSIGAPLPDFDCVQDGVEIPITLNGKSHPSDAPKSCDNPALLDSTENMQPCAKGSRLGIIKSDNLDVLTVFICRKYTHASNLAFNDIAVIQHNILTGATCWYQSEVGTEKNITPDIRSPIHGEVVNANRKRKMIFWKKPSELDNCTLCHNNDPFIVTPYLFQMDMVSKISFKKIKGRYWSYGKPAWNSNVHVLAYNDSKAKICTKCHRIAKHPIENRCQEFINDSIGTGRQSSSHSKIRTKPHSQWMPPPDSNYSEDEILDAVIELSACCDGSEQRRCTLVPIPK